MNIKPMDNSHAPLQAIETAVHPQTAALVDEVVVAQATLKSDKDLPNVFSLQANAPRAAAKAAHVGKLPKDFPKKDLIFADIAEVGVIDGVFRHAAVYEKGGSLKKEIFILTILNDPQGIFRNGTQIVEYGGKVISESRDWRSENLNGVIYYTFIHKDFLVYSTDYTQFIVS